MGAEQCALTKKIHHVHRGWTKRPPKLRGDHAEVKEGKDAVTIEIGWIEEDMATMALELAELKEEKDAVVIELVAKDALVVELAVVKHEKKAVADEVKQRLAFESGCGLRTRAGKKIAFLSLSKLFCACSIQL
jgi:hypothetical protein